MNPHQPASTSPLSLLRNLWRNRSLILQLVQRDVIGRYNGSVLGLAWSFFNPLLLLTVYAFVFTVAFKAQWAGAGPIQGKGYFAIMLFVGMVVHGFFAECLTRAPGVIVGNANYVKKVVFPLELLPVVAVGSALFHTLISVSVLLVGVLALRQSLPATALLMPLVLLPLVLLAQGVTWLLAALGVYLRDIAHSTTLLATVLSFVSPVFYPTSALPEPYSRWIYLNPLTWVMETARAVLVQGTAPHWGQWLVAISASAVVCWLGYWSFQKSRPGFADVL